MICSEAGPRWFLLLPRSGCDASMPKLYCRDQPPMAWVALTAALAKLGRLDEARAAAARVLER